MSPSTQQKILNTSNNNNPAQETISKLKKSNSTNNLNKLSKKNSNSKKNNATFTNIPSSYSSPSSSSIETGHISLEEGSNSVLGISSELTTVADQFMLKKTKKSKKILATNCDSSISKIMGFELFNSNLHESVN